MIKLSKILLEIKRVDPNKYQLKVMDLHVGDRALFSFHDGFRHKDETKVVEITSIQFQEGDNVYNSYGCIIGFNYVEGGGKDAIFVSFLKDDKANKDLNNFHKIESINEIQRLSPEKAKFISFEVGDKVTYKVLGKKAGGIIHNITLYSKGGAPSSIEEAESGWMNIISGVEGLRPNPSIGYGTEFFHLHIQFIPDQNIYYKRDKAIFDSLKKIK
jgi:hypothetical protein